MMQDIIRTAVMLFVVIDPVGTLALFLSVTPRKGARDRAGVALRSILYAGAVLVGFIVLGQLLLVNLGIRIDAFQIAGGLILFIFGVKMIFDTGEEYTAEKPEPGHDVAVFPLAIPSIASPGAIMVVVLLTDNNRHSIPDQMLTTLILLIILVITFLGMLSANRIHKYIGHGGVSILIRVMGLILASLAVETVIEGVLDILADPVLFPPKT